VPPQSAPLELFGEHRLRSQGGEERRGDDLGRVPGRQPPGCRPPDDQADIGIDATHGTHQGRRTGDPPDVASGDDDDQVREQFLGARIPFRSATVIDTEGSVLGEVASVELVTIGQRRGLGLPGGGPKQYVLDVDTATRTVVVGADADLLDHELHVGGLEWAGAPLAEVLVQCSAHGATRPATVVASSDGTTVLRWHEPQRRVAPGQTVVLYDSADALVLAGGIAIRPT
jgi:hypothetical protein